MSREQTLSHEQVVLTLTAKKQEHAAAAAHHRHEALNSSPHDYEHLTKVAAAHTTLVAHYERLITEAKVQEARRRTIRMGIG